MLGHDKMPNADADPFKAEYDALLEFVKARADSEEGCAISFSDAAAERSDDEDE